MKRRLILPSIVVTFVIAAIAIFATVAVRQANYAPEWLHLPLKAPLVSGELVILTLRGPTTTEDIPQAGKGKGDTQTGFEHDLATLFVQELGLRAKFVVMPSYQQLLVALQEGRGHEYASQLKATAARNGVDSGSGLWIQAHAFCLWLGFQCWHGNGRG